jgi:hypothetical protein
MPGPALACFRCSRGRAVVIGTAKATPMLDVLRAAGIFDRNPLVVFDAGCRGGVSAVWDRFGPGLVAHGFDPDIDECERLTASERRAGVRYYPAYVGLSCPEPSHRSGGALNPWSRLSTAHVLEQTAAPSGVRARLASPQSRVGVAEFAANQGLSRIDVLKIDVDGDDYDVLRSAGPLLDAGRVLCVAIEVNYFGPPDERANTFHNVDRYLRQKDFALFGLDIRQYSRADLPAPFVTGRPAHTTFGVPLQGNALYLRDLAAPHLLPEVAVTGIELAKQASLYELFQLPDCAAEVINRYRRELEHFAPAEALLDALVQTIAPGSTYADYCQRFREKPASFTASLPVPESHEGAAAVQELRTRIANLREKVAEARRDRAALREALREARERIREVAASRDRLKARVRGESSTA